MKERDRMLAALNGQPCDRLPAIEWVNWWDKTIARWMEDGLPAGLNKQQLFERFGLDMYHHFDLPLTDGQLTHSIANEEHYEKSLPHLYCDSGLTFVKDYMTSVKEAHEKGDIFIYFSMEGFFWHPRTLFGIEAHLYAFYDYPDLMHEMNRRLAEYHLKCLEVLYDCVKPEFMTFTEDMSYNHGPMLSKELFDEFLAPYYRKVIPEIKRQGTKVLIDTDGDVEPLIPWFEEVGIEGVLPLERQAGVDVNRIRENHPDFILIGGYDKTIMYKGEEAMRVEFERILPAMRAGRYIPCVDHQTPPDVSLENFYVYVRLLKEYTALAAQ